MTIATGTKLLKLHPRQADNYAVLTRILDDTYFFTPHHVLKKM